MSNWKHIRWEPGPDDDPDETPYEFERLTIDATWCLEAGQSDGRFYAEAIHDANGETLIGNFATLDEAKQAAVAWMLQHIAGILKALGADGVFAVRGAETAELVYYAGDPDDELALRLEPPHELVLLARFPEGDDREPGVQSL